jgi:CubicO group peptidase (beta-lactamase class C family)
MCAKSFSALRLDRMREVLQRHVERGDPPGLVALVCRHGEVHVNVIGTKAVDRQESMQRDTLFRIASLTKPVTAAAAMILVEECRLRLDEPVDALLPELANRQVLNRVDGPLDDTVPARRPITLRDLLTMRMGMGYIMTSTAHTYPIMKAANALQLLVGPPRPQKQPAPDEWMRRVGTLPLMHQPGEKWLYDIASDVLGVLIARAADQPLESFMRERIFTPLGMKDTGFGVSADKLGRLPPSYKVDPASGKLAIYDSDGEHSEWARPPAFPSGGGGLVSTVDDYLAFSHMLLNKGRHGNERILSRPAVELMTVDHLTPQQKAGNEIFFGSHSGWGFGVAVNVKRDDLAIAPGRYGWTGGLGTTCATDPAEDMVGILMTQRAMTSPTPPAVFCDFWTLAYQAIDN